jgi:hypothetical protein
MTDPFAMVPVSILSLDISKPALRLFVAMSGHADGETRRCYASQRTLAGELGWRYAAKDQTRDPFPDTRRVRRHLKELEKAQLIRRAGRHVWTDDKWPDQWIVAPYLPVCDVTSHAGDTTSPSRVADADTPMVTSGAADGDNPAPPMVTPRHSNQTHVSDPSSNPLFARSSSRVRTSRSEPRRRREREGARRSLR